MDFWKDEETGLRIPLPNPVFQRRYLEKDTYSLVVGDNCDWRILLFLLFTQDNPNFEMWLALNQDTKIITHYNKVMSKINLENELDYIKSLNKMFGEIEVKKNKQMQDCIEYLTKHNNLATQEMMTMISLLTEQTMFSQNSMEALQKTMNT